MSQLNREEFLIKAVRHLLNHKYISVPQLQRDFKASYKEARLLVADLVGVGAVTYDGGMVFNVNKDFPNLSSRKANSQNDDSADKNAISLCAVYDDMRYTKDEISRAVAIAANEAKQKASAKENNDSYEKRRKELMDRLARIAQDDDDEDDEDDDDDIDEEAIRKTIEEMTLKSLKELVPDEYIKLSEEAKLVLEKYIKANPTVDRLGLRMEMQRQEFKEKRTGGKPEIYNELTRMLLNINDVQCKDMIKAILENK